VEGGGRGAGAERRLTTLIHQFNNKYVKHWENLLGGVWRASYTCKKPYTHS